MAKGTKSGSGSEEMELLIFRIEQTFYGISVSKVREVIERINTVPIPHTPAEVEGIFKIRDEVLTLINLATYFSIQGDEIAEGRGSIIVVEFNKMRCGILVDAVDVIHRLTWDEIEPPSRYLMQIGAPITGTVNVNKRTVQIVDFEVLLSEILGLDFATKPVHGKVTSGSFEKARVLLAEDSGVMRKSVLRIMKENGFENIVACSDGQQAWETIQAKRNERGGPFDLVVTDIEMPRMDGLTLTSKIKQDPNLKDIPVVLYSSLIGDNNLLNGRQTGADAQVGKPESEEMIKAMEACLQKKFGKTPEEEPVPTA
ncbi:MAG: response regulator [candidate division Zixibacteria bacterium]|nr:response regulator [candidate division Zixibacteria bacterium]